METGDGVEDGSEGMIDVLAHFAGGIDILHEETAPGAEGASDMTQDQIGSSLIVNGIKCHYPMEGRRFVPMGEVFLNKAEIGQACLLSAFL